MCRILFFIFLYTMSSAGQELELRQKEFYNNQFKLIQKTWNDEGYWGEALKNLDNRYNEAILVYCKLDSCASSENAKKIKKAIRFSFQNLQDDTGGMLQNGKPVHVRTSLFLYGVINAISHHPKLLNNKKIHRGYQRAIKYLEKPHPFSSNHNMAAMLVMRTLYQKTCENRFLELFDMYRGIVVNSFKQQDDKFGFWPESAKKWRHRLSIPYLFVQNFFLAEYFKYYEDPNLLRLFKMQIAYLSTFVDFKRCQVDVTKSTGGFKKKGIEKVAISNYSFFTLSKSEQSSLQTIFNRTSVEFKKKALQIPYLNHTDLYFRFGLIHDETLW
ncbi:hypothetical protein [Flagellimonas sp.]|uniref:hypothetical protein n=1 Tax=Flagellimonas sp. TaxID=2058762 RepID=UPI003B5060CA